jgi:hypothetical protein
LVFANGALSESFYPGMSALNAMDNVAQAEVIEIFPELSQNLHAFGSHARPNLKPYEVTVLSEYLKKAAA